MYQYINISIYQSINIVLQCLLDLCVKNFWLAASDGIDFTASKGGKARKDLSVMEALNCINIEYFPLLLKNQKQKAMYQHIRVATYQYIDLSIYQSSNMSTHPKLIITNLRVGIRSSYSLWKKDKQKNASSYFLEPSS